MSTLGHREQRVWPPACKPDARRKSCEAAGGIEVAAECKAAVEEKQRVGCETRNLDGLVGARQERWMAGCEQVYRCQRTASKALVSGLNGTNQVLAKVDLAAFEHRRGVRPPQSLDQLHLHIGVIARVRVQEISEHTFDDLRRCGDPQHPGI